MWVIYQLFRQIHYYYEHEIGVIFYRKLSNVVYVFEMGPQESSNVLQTLHLAAQRVVSTASLNMNVHFIELKFH